MLKKCAESVTWQTQAQQATTDRHIELNVTLLNNTKASEAKSGHGHYHLLSFCYFPMNSFIN